MATLGVGDAAPDFTLTDADGETVSLEQFRGKSEVVLFFYPKDNSPVCTMEACAFRDSYEAFRDAGAAVIGLSGDSDESHRQFAGRHKLPYHLVSDADGSLRARFGVTKTLGIFPGRVTFLIDKQGVIRHVVSSSLIASRHVDEILHVLHNLQKS